MKDRDLRALLDLVMCCDPWPVNRELVIGTIGRELYENDDYNETIIKDMLLLKSVKRNYPNWIDAYHNFEVTK